MKCSNYRNLRGQKTDTDSGTLSQIAPGKRYTLRVNWPGFKGLTETQLSGNKMWCAANNHNYMCYICVKTFLDSSFNEAVIDKILILMKLPQISHTHKNKHFTENFKHNILR